MALGANNLYVVAHIPAAVLRLNNVMGLQDHCWSKRFQQFTITKTCPAKITHIIWRKIK